eukprot:TRINITY_DN1370_c0_g1_i1.p1 TRINITY_DN1370_c0_g1~~TRINITY_DN1370_c0_g1_i1.p1  ORF type:complete len:330 (-),score=104.79 TRINITY_DN1370_c0_g1_i1:137-1126(-)
MERDLGGGRSRQKLLIKMVALIAFTGALFYLYTIHQEQMNELTTTKAILLLHIGDLQNKLAEFKLASATSISSATNEISSAANKVLSAVERLQQQQPARPPSTPGSKGCKNGKMVDGKCVCVAGYTGETCDHWSSPDGGAWSADLHIRDKFHDEKIIETALKLIGVPVKSAMDVGCGLGLYLNDFHALGAKRCVGVEPSPMNKDTDSPFYSGICQQLEIDAFNLEEPEIDLKEEFDVVMSVEVVEHIDREKHSRFFNFVTKHAKHAIIFSGAYKGQGGHGHISERPWEEWLEEFKSRGWEWDSEASMALRKVSKYPWFRSNLAIFRPKK